MPTYRNDSNATRYAINTASKQVAVAPGETVQVYYLLTAADWTKTSDEPYYNPVLAADNTVSSTGPGDPATISLQSGTDKVEIYNNSSADITLLLNAAGNTPGYQIPADTIRTIEGLQGYVDTLILQFSAAVSAGEVVVHEFGRAAE